MTLTARVDEVMRPSASLFPYFVLDTSVLDGLDTLAPDTVTTDISSDVRRVGTQRGKQRDIDDYSTGHAEVELNNQARKYDPNNTSSPYYGNIAPMRQVYVTAVLNGVDYPLFRGYIERWTVDYSEQKLPLAGIEAADAFLLLARAEALQVAAAYSGDLTSARLSRLLNLTEVNFPTDIRSIATGNTTCGTTTFGENALTYAQTIARTEGGDLYVSKTGVLTFEASSTAPGSSAATFSDDGAAGSIRYQFIDQDTGSDLLYNRVIISGTSGTQQVVSDSVSIADNQITSTLDRTGLLASSDSVMADLASLLLARYSTAETRLRQVRVDVNALSDARKADLFNLELTDRVTVTTTPTGSGSPSTISQQAVVVGIDHAIDMGARNWSCTVTFQSGTRALGMVLDDAVLGKLDVAFLGH